MSFKLTIEVPDSKLMKTLRLLSGNKVKVYVEATEQYLPGWDNPRKKGKKTYSTRPRKDSILTMTGKTAQPDSKIAAAMTVFEKFEKSKGIGTITVEQFRTKLVTEKMPKQMQQRCITEKFLSYI